jgi:transcriptional regulator with XRE-family HTH domain
MDVHQEKPPIASNLRALKERAGVPWREIAAAIGTGERQVHEWARPDGAFTASWPNVVKLAEFFSEKLGVDIEPGEFYLQPDEEST